jgi:hypothetical protein
MRTLRAALVFLLIAVGFCSGNAVTSATSADPVYVATSNGWMGLYGHDNEYAKFSMTGKQIELQDAYHILLKPGLGMMVSFADKAEFGGGANLLENHEKWELGYWQSKAYRAEAITRKDLSNAREDLRVTEMKLHRNDGAQMSIFMIALASKDGVFVLAVSPGNSDGYRRTGSRGSKILHTCASNPHCRRGGHSIKSCEERNQGMNLICGRR